MLGREQFKSRISGEAPVSPRGLQVSQTFSKVVPETTFRLVSRSMVVSELPSGISNRTLGFGTNGGRRGYTQKSFIRCIAASCSLAADQVRWQLVGVPWAVLRLLPLALGVDVAHALA